MKQTQLELLAPAGSPESLRAAVRCGASAVYLGGKAFNARRGAANFDDEELREAVAYCHERDVKVYVTLNTLVFDGETRRVREAVRTLCACAVDAVLVQDLAVAALVREAAPSLSLHASTQMSVHNLAGAKLLEELGFARVVLARELSLREIEAIARGTSLEIECFVHGALCMSVSGQCTLSAMIGSRSGNRGACAQPCRLPFAAGGASHALSLKDMSYIRDLAALREAGVCCLKIEGRMKRPEYVAAAVTACREALAGGAPDYEALEAVFSRSGFTDGYLRGRRGREMFGTRGKDDVVAASGPLLGRLKNLYKDERRAVPVDFTLRAVAGEPCVLGVRDDAGHAIEIEGPKPETAHTAPTDEGRVRAALNKTGGTPYLTREVRADIGAGLMLPAAALNELRRRVLGELGALRRERTPHAFDEAAADEVLDALPRRDAVPDQPALRVRVGRAEQLCAELCEGADLVIVPESLWDQVDPDVRQQYRDKMAVELPRASFGSGEELRRHLEAIRREGVERAVAGTLGAVRQARDAGFAVCGDFGLNLTNTAALGQAAALGLRDATLSFENTLAGARALGGALPRGILAYGYLPLMLLRNCPHAAHAGGCKSCGGGFPELRDRRGERFFLSCARGVAELHNCVPLVLSEKMDELRGLDFATLYFTRETPRECLAVWRAYRDGRALDGRKTQGLYLRGVE